MFNKTIGTKVTWRGQTQGPITSANLANSGEAMLPRRSSPVVVDNSGDGGGGLASLRTSKRANELNEQTERTEQTCEPPAKQVQLC